MHCFFLKKVDALLKLSPSKHRPPTPFNRQNKTNKAVTDMVTFLFSVHTIAEAKAIRRARQGGARA